MPRERLRHLLLVSFLLLASTPSVAAACLNPSRLAHSTVSITRYFDKAEPAAQRGLRGIGGTAWFLSPTKMVTVEHVTTAMMLSPTDWKQLELVDADRTQFIDARIQRVVGTKAEKLAIIELRRSIPDARTATIRTEPLVPEEPVMTLAYPAGRSQVVSGRFVQFGSGDKLAGMALLELYDGDNRLVVDHGASGAPVIDCNGRVAAVVSDVFTQTIQWAYREIRISTAWGMPNVVSVPVQALELQLN